MCLGYCLSTKKMIRYSKNLGEAVAPLAMPIIRYKNSVRSNELQSFVMSHIISKEEA